MGGTILVRMTYITSHPALWMMGWGLWLLATGSLVLLFYASLELCVRPSRLISWLPLVFAILGAVPDAIGVSVQLSALPHLAAQSASPFATPLFELMDRLSIAFTGFLNNFWYGLGFLTLAPCLRQAGMPAWLIRGSIGLGGITLLLSLAALLHHQALLLLTTGLTMAGFVLWSFGLGWYALHARLGHRR